MTLLANSDTGNAMARSEQATKLTPLYRPAEKAGARFGVHAGWHVPVGYSALEDETAAAQSRVALADSSANGKVFAEGLGVESVVRAAWPDVTLDVGQGTTIDPGHIYGLRADLFFLSTPPGGETKASEALNAAARQENAFVTVTDVTHGRSELTIVGPRAAELLSRLCGLDFRPEAFPNNAARQSSVAKTSQLIIRSDCVAASGTETVIAFTLIGARSLAAYLWETVLEAGRDLDIVLIGQAALEALRERP
jgi:heterotetrameric sarcosine oxidase gamma subunit